MTTTTRKTAMFAAAPIVRAVPVPSPAATEPHVAASPEEAYRFFEEQDPRYSAAEVLTRRHLGLLVPLLAIGLSLLGACSDSSTQAERAPTAAAASEPSFAPVQYFGEEFAAAERDAQLKADGASSPSF